MQSAQMHRSCFTAAHICGGIERVSTRLRISVVALKACTAVNLSFCVLVNVWLLRTTHLSSCRQGECESMASSSAS